PSSTLFPYTTLFRSHWQVLNEHASVNSHVIHALLRLLFNHFEHHTCREVFNPFHPRNRFVDGHRPDRHRRMTQNCFPNFVDVARSEEHTSELQSLAY